MEDDFLRSKYTDIICNGSGFILYLSLNVFQNKPSELGIALFDYRGKWILYGLFCLRNFLIWDIFIYGSYKKDPFFWIANISLLFFPVVKFGKMNDLCMRGSIPALFLISIMAMKVMLNTKEKLCRNWKKGMLTAAFLAMAVLKLPYIQEYAESVKLGGLGCCDEWNSLIQFVDPEGGREYLSTAYNYVGYGPENSLFEKYVSAP